MKKILLLLLLLPVCAFAQQGNLPLNDQWMTQSEARMVESRGFLFAPHLLKYDGDSILALMNTPDSALVTDPIVVAWPVQTSFRPIIEQGHALRKYYNDHNREPYGFHKRKQKGFGAWIGNYHRANSLIQVEKPANGDIPLFRLYIDPLLNLQKNYLQSDTSTENLYTNSRGVIARGDIGTKVSFETSFWENQSFLPAYQDSFALQYGVIPGQGRWKKFKNTGYDYAMASGFLSWSVCNNFNVQVGHGKHFVGDGARSLLLSDNSFNYPFARLTGWFGANKNMQYTVMYTSFMNLTDGGVSTPVGTERLFQKKSGVFHHFTYRFLRTFEVSVFQGAIFEHADSTNRQNLNFWYYNPVMFTSLAKYGLKDTNNYMLGFTFRADLFRTASIYGQFVMDELGSGYHAKTGFQLGARYFNAFTVKNLHLRVEYNKVNPYTYSHDDALQSWSHYNQALAHPLGAGFSEINGSLYYKFRDFFLYGSAFVANANVDTALVNAGQNIFMSNASVNEGAGRAATLTTLDVHLGWMISYASNLNLSVGFKTRKIESVGNSQATSFVYVALRTSLTNTNFDFF
jgi:hypothetical protein